MGHMLAFLILVSYVSVNVAFANHYRNKQQYVSHCCIADNAIENAALRNVTGISAIQCGRHCRNDNRCKAFIFNDSQQKAQCTLLSPPSGISDTGVDFFMVDRCVQSIGNTHTPNDTDFELGKNLGLVLKKDITSIKVDHHIEKGYLGRIRIKYGSSTARKPAKSFDQDEGDVKECHLSSGEYITRVHYALEPWNGKYVIGAIGFGTSEDRTCGPYGAGSPPNETIYGWKLLYMEGTVNGYFSQLLFMFESCLTVTS